jgi:hypothetical protein
LYNQGLYNLSNRLMFCIIRDCAPQILVYKSIIVLIQNGHPLDAELQLASGIVPDKLRCEVRTCKYVSKGKYWRQLPF